MSRRWRVGGLAGVLLAGLGTGLASASAPWADATAIEATQARAAALFEPGSRMPGMPANLALEAAVAKRFAASGFVHGEIAFTAPAFVPGATALMLPEGGEIALHPLHPGLVRPGNFSERSFDARLVDMADGGPADLEALSGIDLQGALVLMNMHSGSTWKRLLRFGVRGFIFAGEADIARRDAYDKIPTSEVAVPRFYATQADAERVRAAFGAARSIAVGVTAEPSRWEPRELRNPWVLIPGTAPSLEQDIVVLTAALDTGGMVPTLAEGGEAGANVLVLLDLLDQFSEAPPARSVLLTAVNARSQNYLGDRMLAWYLMSPQGKVEAVRAALARDIRLQERTLYFMEQLAFTPESRADDEAFLVSLRTLSDNAIGRQITLKDPLVALCQRDVNAIKTQQLMLHREHDTLRVLIDQASADDVAAVAEARQRMAAIEAEREALTARLNEHVNVLTLFNRVGVQTVLSDLTPDEEAILRGYVKVVVDRNREWAELNRSDLDRSERNGLIRQVTGGRIPTLVLALDQVWSRPELAFSSGIELGMAPWADRFGFSSMRIARTLPAVAEGRHPNRLFDALTQVGGLHERVYVPSPSGMVDFYQRMIRSPALSLNTPHAQSVRSFTPDDTFAALEWRHVAEGSAFLRAFLPALLADPAALSGAELPPPPIGRGRLRAVRINAFTFDEFSAAVEPELPVPGSMILLTDPKAEMLGFSGDGVGRVYFALTDSRASAVFYGFREVLLSSSAFQFDATFTTVRFALDVGETHDKLDSDISGSARRTLSLIPVTEFVVRDRTDVPALGTAPIAVERFFPLSAVRNAAPRRYGISGAASGFSSKRMPEHIWGPVGLYIAPGDRLKLLTHNRRLALNASADHPEGIGFIDDVEMGPDFLRRSMHDMGYLNRHRVAQFRDVADGLTTDLLARAARSTSEAEAAAAEADHATYLRKLFDAVGAQVKAYQQIAATTNDMLKAVVFYMALLLPFCFFVQKLLFKSVRIEAQLGLFAALFILCYTAFRMMHPAFRVARAPEAMFIAFVMGGLGMFVIWLLHGRFEGEMKLLFSALRGGDAQVAGYGMVSQQALLIGVSNMKRRRIRTMLTTATIVLVTFTMLAFTSVSRRMSPTVVDQSRPAPYAGLMVHWPGAQRMDEASHGALQDLFFADADVLTRRWLLPPVVRGQSGLFRVETDDGRAVPIEGVLGLDPAEDGFLDAWPTVAGGFFSKRDAREVVIAASLAEVLGFGAEHIGTARVHFGGLAFRLAGIVDDQALRSLRDLNGLSILPIRQVARQADQSETAAALEAETLADEGSVFYIEPASLLMMPEETARRLGAEPYSVSVRLRNADALWPLVDRLLMATRARFFIGSHVPFSLSDAREGRANPPGVYYVGAGYRTAIGGLAMLLIPLLIASTIILNTMLGSVFERKNEIAVYNAVGLNPTHIGLFFLAESFVYGIIGAVGGYMIGQGMSLALNRFGWIDDVNLNFSSLSVAYVIVFTLAVVLLSTLYPAVVATRAAVPSGKRKWSMPAHQDGDMTVVFPFIYQPDLAAGAMHYIDSFFARFTEASTGNLIAERFRCEVARDARDRFVYRVGYRLALAPYDLGVTQTTEFESAFDERVDAYRVTLHSVRESGQDTNWMTTNKPFLEQLRKLLLNWRNLPPAEHGVHIREAIGLFESGGRHGGH